MEGAEGKPDRVVMKRAAAILYIITVFREMGDCSLDLTKIDLRAV